MVMTTLPPEAMPADAVGALYRLRWQVELAFERPKSLVGLEASSPGSRASPRPRPAPS
jgi:hypothetical protein